MGNNHATESIKLKKYNTGKKWRYMTYSAVSQLSRREDSQTWLKMNKPVVMTSLGQHF